MRRMQGKRAVVTGGTTGIGLATALLFRDEGAKVAVTGIDQGRLDQARTQLGSDAVAIRADAARPPEVAAAFQEAARALGGLDVVFLNAGIARFAGLAELTEATFDELLAVNVKGVLFGAQAALPHLSPGASILVNTSVNAHIGMAGTLGYAATKAAVASMVRVLAGELAPRKIRVNGICPGPIETPIYGKLGLPEAELQAVAAGILKRVPAGRFGTPDEVARAALFLSSAEASYVNGAELVVDGGWLGVG